MKSYPIMLNMQGRRAVVVGGGQVGLRKAQALVNAGADVTLVAERLDNAAATQGMRVVRARYAPELLDGAALVMACTDAREVNTQIADDARQRGALVNAADQPEDCDFFLPACVRDGEVVVAIGTGGSAPALAGEIRDVLAAALPEGTGAFAAALANLRDELRAKVHDSRPRHEIMKQLCSRASFDEFRRRGPAALRELLGKLTAGW